MAAFEVEIFIGDGAKSSLGHFGDILSVDNIVAVSDPVYPVYIDANVMEGRAGRLLPNRRWSHIIYNVEKAIERIQSVFVKKFR